MTQLLIDRTTLEQLVDCPASDYERMYALKKQLRAALASAEPTCTWSKDPDFEMGDTYDSSCGEKWSFIDGGPTENRVRFCQGCGKPVKLTKEQP